MRVVESEAAAEDSTEPDWPSSGVPSFENSLNINSISLKLPLFSGTPTVPGASFRKIGSARLVPSTRIATIMAAFRRPEKAENEARENPKGGFLSSMTLFSRRSPVLPRPPITRTHWSARSLCVYNRR